MFDCGFSVECGLPCLQEMYDRGFSAMEKSHQRAVLEMKVTHNQEIDRLCQEKEELLRMEAQDTQAGRNANQTFTQHREFNAFVLFK